jgi:hypothetical protein
MKYFVCLFICLNNLSALSNITFQEPESIHTHTARILMRRQNTATATEELKKALHGQPGNVKISTQLSRMYYNQGQYDQALELLLPIQTSATKNNNLIFYIGLLYEKKGDFEQAYLYYLKAFKLDPTLYAAKLRIARLFIQKGLYFDAATHLKNLLEINPDYKPAQTEFEVTLQLIRENKNNVFRRGSMVITFPDYNLIRDIEEWYPYLQEKVYYLQNALGVQNKVVWVRIVEEIKSPFSPPAFFHPGENVIYLTVDTLRRKYTSLFTHELSYMFFEHLRLRKAPKWFLEGVALYFSRPNLLKHMNLRRLSGGWDILDKKFYNDKRYLHFDKLTQEERLDLFHAFLIARYMIQKYGWDNVEKFAKSFEGGKKRINEIIWDVFHIKQSKLMLDFDTYITVNHFFGS